MRYVVRHYRVWHVVKQHQGGYLTGTVARHRWELVARLHAWWLNRKGERREHSH